MTTLIRNSATNPVWNNSARNSEFGAFFWLLWGGDSVWFEPRKRVLISSKSTFYLHEEWQYINASLTFICSAWYRTSKTRQISTQHRNQSCIVSRAPLVFSNLSVFNILQWVYDVSNSQNNPFFYWSVPGTNWSHTTTAAGLQDPAQLCCPPPSCLSKQ